MFSLKSWRALVVREFIEHRISFFYFPVGILTLVTLSAVSALVLHRFPDLHGMVIPYSLKLFELGYMALLALWLFYLAIAAFFYFGDAFNADRRNNAMLFWKSMPVTDLKVLVSKALTGLAVFPLTVLVIGIVSGIVFYVLLNVASYVEPAIGPIAIGAGLTSLGEITLFGLVYYGLGILWYAPFFAWVGGLSTVFGRWSLPLAFVLPGLATVVENVAFYGQGPSGGYIGRYLNWRWHFGLSDTDLTNMLGNPGLFRADDNIARLVAAIDWLALGEGLVFTAIVLLLASEYRRRRIA